MMLRRHRREREKGRTTSADMQPPDAETEGSETAVQPDPKGTVDQVMAYVGDDPERAAEALAKERDKGNRARVTLVSQLEPMVEDTGEEADTGEEVEVG